MTAKSTSVKKLNSQTKFDYVFGHAVAQMFEALRYKLEGGRLDS